VDAVVKLCGRFTLMHTEQGFCWCLTAPTGLRWYWHPEARQWTAQCQGSPTEAEATVGLDWTLGHERAGDLNRCQDLPPAHQALAHDSPRS
jgi:hypothetical protein